MKILMLLSNPFVTDIRVYKEAKILVDSRNKVTVIVWDRRHEYKPEEVIEGIRLVRLHNKFLMKLLPNDVFRNPLWWRKAYKKGLELYKNGFDFDVVHCHDLDTLQIGIWLKKKTGCKLIYDAHEIFGDMIKGEHPVLSRFAFMMEGKLIKYVDYIITIDEPFKEYYDKLFGKPVTIVMNCKDLIYPDYKPTNNDIFTLVYIGLMSRGRFFPQILDVVENLNGVKLILAGKKESMFDEIKELSKKYSNIEFLGTIPSDKILALTRRGDVTFVIVDLKRQYRLNVYNKQFEAMVCGRPIIVTKGTYAGEMTEKLKCGITVDYDKESVKEAIIKLRDNPKLCKELGKNAFKAAKERYNWEIEKKNLLELYEKVL